MISLNFSVIPGNLTNLGPFINSWSITYQTNIFIFGSVSKSWVFGIALTICSKDNSLMCHNIGIVELYRAHYVALLSLAL